MSGPTVSAGYAKALLDLCVSKGADLGELMRRSGLDVDLLTDKDSRIPFETYKRLMRTGKKLTDNPALALHYGESVDFHAFSVAGLIAHASETVGEAVAQLNRYGRLDVELDGVGDRLQAAPGERGLWVVDTRPDPNEFPELTESTFARMMCVHRRDFCDVSFVKEICFTHAPPDYRGEYERIFEVPVVFESDRNAMLMDRDFMSIRLAHSRPYVFGVLSRHAEELLEELQRSKTMRGRLESELIPILHKGDIAMTDIAGQLGMSRQSLYRKLKAEGASYETVLDELRARMAQYYLSGKKASVNETAYLVGFSHANAFSRAFRRWTGMSPKKFLEHR